ncbi:hypothetical protein GCM10009785_12600 [Brooklawnia cerclae]|uniref:glycosyl hydrolase n=1 Tax=Brooklawnia cerclae TaxID=349934 RepID=UPI0031E40737
MTRHRRAGWAIGLLLVMAGCSPPSPGPGDAVSTATTASEEVLGDAQVAGLVEALPQQTVASLRTARLADGLTPPTNRWYSGLVFGDDPMPVFPLPLSFELVDGGFAFGLPRVTATARTIAGGSVADVSVDVGAASSVVASDDASVVVLDDLGADGQRLGRTTIAQGSPFVSWVADEAAAVGVPAGFAPAGAGLYTLTVGSTTYALRTDAEVSAGSAAVDAGQSLVFWAVPEGHDAAELAEASSHIVTGSHVGYQVDDESVTTELTYLGDGPTAIARMPHQVSGESCDLGSYPSIYGTLELCAGSTLTWSATRLEATSALDLSGLDDTERDELTTLLDADLADLGEFPADTYFGGKALQRAAMLLMVADQLGASAQAEQLAAALDAQLTLWTDPEGCQARAERCFVYDPEAKGLVGLATSFGSEEFNDHHFHYGYFLYAAAVLAAHDPSVVDRYAPVMTLLAADIASDGSSFFPDRRAFDPYASHSWASGTSPFGDGNNQESVSEAVNAYAGLELWAQASGDDALATEAAWMASSEAAASQAYWVEPDLGEFAGYDAGIVSINWGGKRDYATWFTDAASAKLAILLLPMSPSSGYLAGDPERIRANVDEATGGDFAQQYGDYLLMYSALAGPDDRERALEAARDFPDELIDDGMTRTYLMAWLLSLE